LDEWTKNTKNGFPMSFSLDMDMFVDLVQSLIEKKLKHPANRFINENEYVFNIQIIKWMLAFWRVNFRCFDCHNHWFLNKAFDNKTSHVLIVVLDCCLIDKRLWLCIAFIVHVLHDMPSQKALAWVPFGLFQRVVWKPFDWQVSQNVCNES